MNTQTEKLLKDLKSGTEIFKNVILCIENQYSYELSGFKNGTLCNQATENQGSAKVFAFAKINGLNKEDTLLLFAEHYKTVLENHNGTDHQNIRQFMENGWEGIVLIKCL